MQKAPLYFVVIAIVIAATIIITTIITIIIIVIVCPLPFLLMCVHVSLTWFPPFWSVFQVGSQHCSWFAVVSAAVVRYGLSMDFSIALSCIALP